MLQLLFVTLMAAHLLAMNIASVGPLFCIWLRGLRSPVADLRNKLGNSLAWLSVAAFVLGMSIGGILLLVTPTTGLIEALHRFPARAYWVAGLELVFTFICLLAYAMSWQKLQSRPFLQALFPLLASTNLLYHFPPMMAVLGKLATNPQWTSLESIDRPAFLGLMRDGEILSISIHFALASLAVAALTLLVLYARLQQDNENEQKTGMRIVRTAAMVALIASTLQLPVGIWVISTLSGQARNSLMGGNLMASLLLVGGMLMTFVFLQHLVGIVLGDVRLSTLRRVGLLLVILVLIMTATLRAARLAETDLAPSQQKKAAAETLPPRLPLIV